MRGYCGIALYNPKTPMNIGTVFRNCMCLNSDFVCIIGSRYKKFKNQASDTTNTWKHKPVYEYGGLDDFYKHIPHDCQLVAVEVDGQSIKDFNHPERAIYLFGPEDGSLPKIDCKRIKIETSFCLNLAVATGIVLFDRLNKG